MFRYELQNIVYEIPMRIEHCTTKALLDVVANEELEKAGFSTARFPHHVHVSTSIKAPHPEGDYGIAVIGVSKKADLLVLQVGGEPDRRRRLS
jgi:hypothetical protein